MGLLGELTAPVYSRKIPLLAKRLSWGLFKATARVPQQESTN